MIGPQIKTKVNDLFIYDTLVQTSQPVGFEVLADTEKFYSREMLFRL
jgi:hypothetical protein